MGNARNATKHASAHSADGSKIKPQRCPKLVGVCVCRGSSNYYFYFYFLFFCWWEKKNKSAIQSVVLRALVRKWYVVNSGRAAAY